MMNRRSFAQLMFLVSLFGMASIVPTCHADDRDKEFASKLADIVRRHEVPGMCAAVIKADGLVQSKCFGVRKRGTTDKIELTDRFPIGSNTKSMTAALAAVLVEADKIKWKTTIGDVWPTTTSADIHPQLRDVTLDQLLSDQSGLPANISDISPRAWGSFFEEKQTPTLERRRMLKLALSPAPTQPQGRFVYSNLGYAVASAMLEAATGKSYESMMKKHIFDPLEMRSADFRSMKSVQRPKSSLLWGHSIDGTPVDPTRAGSENPTVYAAVGTVHLTIEDFSRYARWHLAGKPAPVLRSQVTFDQLHEPLVDMSGTQKYGRGWVCLSAGSGPAMMHDGSNTNTYALIWVVPDANVAAIACTNTGEPQAFKACDEMVGFLLQKYAGPESTKSDGKNHVDPERLVGRYQLAPNFIFDVRYQDGHMLVGITNQPTQEVFPDSPTKWSYRSVKAQLEFHLRASGSAYALTLHQNGLAQKATRIRR